jgi:S1-C subfamily serine protease
MKTFLITFALSIISNISFSQNYLFKEDFDNNLNSWYTIQNSLRNSKIENGILIDWSGNGDYANTISLPFDKSKEHSIIIQFANLHNKKTETYFTFSKDKNGDVKKNRKTIDNPVWGFVWGYKDNQNFHCVIFQCVNVGEYYPIRSMETKIFSYVGGKEIIHKDWSSHKSEFYDLETGFNKLKIEKRSDNATEYGIFCGKNGETWIGTCPLTQWYGDATGLYVGEAAEVAIDYLYITSSSVTSNLKKTNAKYSSWDSYRLKKHFASNSLDNIEGIWEDFDLNIDSKEMRYGGNYKVGLIKADDGYDLIYLSGENENNSNWKEGMIKGHIVKTGSDGIYKAEWYSSDMSIYDNVYVFLDENKLLNFAFKDKNSSTKMLKLLPTSNSSKENNESKNNDDYTSSGSGIILNNSGIIATNYHVVKDAESILIQVTQNGNIKKYNAKVIASDKTNDLSILEITDAGFKGFGTVPFGIKNSICDVGTNVFSMGYPMSSVLGEEVKITDGLISSKTGYQGDIVTYQISVPIQPGNSGGPLFDKQGNLVGITNAGIPSADNVGYAIKTSYLKNLIDVAPEKISLPVNNTISTLPFTEKVKTLSKFVVFIKVK